MSTTATVPARDPALAATVAALAEPFDPREVKWKPQMVKGNRAMAMCYIDARLVQDRLDDVLGVENWQDRYEILPDGGVVCTLRLWLGGRWVSKTDVGSPSEQPDGGDRMKAAFSDALKRAAVKFGVGRYLYRLPAQWVDYDPAKKQLVQIPQLPAFAVPKGKPRQQPAPAEKPQTDPRREALDEAFRASGLKWGDCMAWLNSAYPGAAVPYSKTTRMSEIEPARVDHLIRHLDTLAAQRKGA